MKKIKIAQIGMNRYSHAPEIFHTMKLHPEVFDLVGYALVEDERDTCAAKIENFFAGYPELSLEEILGDPTIEAVAVETDEIHLLKYAQMAADAGKHIHMEKPGSPNLAAFERLIETMRKSGKVFHTGYMYRYNPFIADAIARAKLGEFGRIYSVEAHMSRLDPLAVREWLEVFEGGMMFYLGCHLVDLVMQIQGVPDRVVPFNTRTGQKGINTEDFGFAVLQYPNATSVIRTAATELGGMRRRQLVICGEDRTIEIKPLEQTVEDAAEEYVKFNKKVEVSRDEQGAQVREEFVSAPFQRYRAMLLAFAAMVRGETQNPNTLDYELALFKTVLRCCGMKVED